MCDVSNICPDFPDFETNIHKQKIYTACTMFIMERYEALSSKSGLNSFCEEKYYTLKDLSSNDNKTNTNVKKITPPKKKRTPVKKSDESDEENKPKKKSNEDTEVFDKDSNEKKKKKVFPIIFNRNAKTIINFIIGRWLWEVYFIEPDGEECPETKTEIEEYIKNAILNDWIKSCNISQLVIHSVNIFRPSSHIENSHGMDKYIRSKFGDNLENSSFVNFASEYITEFMKLVMLKIANRFWIEKTQTCNKKVLENVLRDIELAIPVECKTVSNGLIDDINKYDNIMNPIKEKSAETDKSDKTEKKTVDKKVKTDKSNKKAVDKKSKTDKSDKKSKTDNKPVKKPITRNSHKDDYEFNDDDSEFNDDDKSEESDSDNK